MAGNFLKYGAAEATFGSKNAGDLPVDAHELIALCAPRLTFISYGVPEKGDAKWLDQQGSYMAAVAARPVFRLLGAKDLGAIGRLPDREDAGGERRPARRPARLAAARRRPHRRPELEVLHPVGRHGSSASRRRRPRRRAGSPADVAVAAHRRRTRMTAHAQLLEKAKQGGIDVYFVGDSITRRWGATDYPELLANWKQNFFGWNAGELRLGRRPDREHPLAPRERRARRRQPEGHRAARRHEQRRRAAADGDGQGRGHHARACKAILDACRAEGAARDDHPDRDLPAQRQHGGDAGDRRGSTRESARLADGKPIRYLNVNDKLADADGPAVRRHDERARQAAPDAQGLSGLGRCAEADSTELLGPPAATDHAPPPTGDPSARARGNR